MNTAGQVGGFLSPIILAQLVKHFGDWSIALQVSGCLFLVGAICWVFIDPTKPLRATH
jgi:sugar phosphate permease